MAAQTNKIIFNFLKSIHFHYSENWVTDCVDYYMSANPNITIEKLKEEVKQQWLLSNLRDSKVGVFPSDLKSSDKVILNGKYVVQVETVIDSGQPRYAQLQFIRNKALGNLKVGQKPKEDELPERRCLTMNITDGVQNLHALEYELIPAIKLNDPDMLPGFKMLISGPVTCRKGMFILMQKNVAVLGGEVDVLIEKYSTERLLMAALGIDGPVMARDENPLPVVLSPELNQPSVVNSNAVDNYLNDNDDFFFDIPMEIPADESPNPIASQLDDHTLDEAFMSVPDEAPSFRSQSSPVPSLQPISNMATVFPSETMDVEPAFQQSTSTVPSKKIVDSEPFVYLSQILEENSQDNPIYNVKAVILTLKTKIVLKDEQFLLTAKICDGSLSIDVDFSSEVLEDLLGFGPSEMAGMVKEKKKNSAIAERLKSAFIGAQQKLITLNSIFKIQFHANKAPLVLAIEDVTSLHLYHLKSRQS